MSLTHRPTWKMYHCTYWCNPWNQISKRTIVVHHLYYVDFKACQIYTKIKKANLYILIFNVTYNPNKWVERFISCCLSILTLWTRGCLVDWGEDSERGNPNPRQWSVSPICLNPQPFSSFAPLRCHFLASRPWTPFCWELCWNCKISIHMSLILYKSTLGKRQ